MIPLLSNQGAGATGEAVTLADNDVQLIVTADTWGGETVQLQTQIDGAWIDLPGVSFTESDSKVYRGFAGSTIRAVTTGSGGTMAGVNVWLGQRRGSF